MIKIGLIGCGAWGKNLLRNFSNLPGCVLLSCCDENPKQIESLCPSYPKVEFTQNHKEIIDNPNLDAVVIATPPATHFKLCKAAILADKDVFVEKPLVLDTEKGEELVRLAEKKKRILMVGHIMEYHAATLKLKEYIDKGELGKIYYVYSTRVNLGKVRDIENALWSFAPHDISMILFLLGKSPVSVTATGECYLQKDKGIEDVVFVNMHFEDGTMAHIHVSWLDPHKERRLTVVGDKKMAVFDDTRSAEKIWIYDKGVDTRQDYNTYGEYLSLRFGDVLIPQIPGTEPLKTECEHFIDCVQNRRTPRSDGRDGLRVSKVLDAAQRSLKMGGSPVRID
ncbi:MAG: Gfo/Idh/MocA family oxidoreductase [candidate division Zixibacteria bacterium]|nr:Gfo/Idh/MocA family oxidoreductase [candidate division Zixibacteria bacterium]